MRLKSHTTCVGTTFEFKRTSRPLRKYVLYSMNEGSMNGTRMYYCHVVTCHASSQQRENLKSPLYISNAARNSYHFHLRFNVDWFNSSEEA